MVGRLRSCAWVSSSTGLEALLDGGWPTWICSWVSSSTSGLYTSAFLPAAFEVDGLEAVLEVDGFVDAFGFLMESAIVVVGPSLGEGAGVAEDSMLEEGADVGASVAEDAVTGADSGVVVDVVAFAMAALFSAMMASILAFSIALVNLRLLLFSMVQVCVNIQVWM